MRALALCLLAALVLAAAPGCARMGKLTFVDPIAPVVPADIAKAQDSSRTAAGLGDEGGDERPTPDSRPQAVLRAMFADTLVGFQPGTADSAKRFLGRLRRGYTADTLNLIVMGDNRPSYRTTKLSPQTTAMKGILTLKPMAVLKGLVNIPIFLIKGTIPDLTFWRDIPSLITKSPSYGRELPVLNAIIARVDSIEARGNTVAAVINSGDIVKDGRVPKHWSRFLRITKPLYDRVPYLPIAGNHERTDDSLGVLNWQTATGLPIKGNLLHYCFDSADGWVRFIALDSNPMTDPKHYWTRDDEVAATNEQITWMVARLKEHRGPAMVFLHHPPFCLGYHRPEWESDSLLSARRQTMVTALREAGLAVLVAGHEHAYERAALVCGDAVLVCIVAGGGGSPLHTIPTGDEAGRLFAAYQLKDCGFKPENVYASMSYSYTVFRYWFGGGDLRTYAVDVKGKDQLIDEFAVDLKRFGIPEIDQHKIPVPPSSGPKQQPPVEERSATKSRTAAPADSARADAKPVTKPSSKPKSAPTPTGGR